MTNTLLIVPRPGRWRSGIHASSTSAPVMITTVPKRQPGLVGDALVEHVPRVEAEPGADLQRHAHAVEDQAGVELQRGGGCMVCHDVGLVGLEIHSQS